MGRSRGGLTSKIHAVVDTNGMPVHLALTPGEAHGNRLCSVLLSALLPQTMLLADRGYDADWIRELAHQQGAWANIPPKRNRKDPICFSPYLYRARNLIERFFNKIKQCRRVATRYDKLAANYLAFVKLASIRIWLRANESTPLSSRRDAANSSSIHISHPLGRNKSMISPDFNRRVLQRCQQPTLIQLIGRWQIGLCGKINLGLHADAK